MPLMKCAVDRTIETTLGYVFEFKKNEPLEVPPHVVAALMERGAFPAEGEEEDAAAATEVPPTDKQLEPADIEIRRGKIIEAMLTLFAKNELLFTATGKPNPAQLSGKVGFRVGADERDAAWTVVQPQVAPGA